MIVPPHIKCEASFSEDTLGPDGRGQYRFTLWRRNLLADDPGAYAEFHDRYIQFICLNPSTADERLDDPTVKRCWQRTRRLGYGAFVMTNLFAYRATLPENMKAAPEPIGDWNDDWLEGIAAGAGLIILGWGTDGAFADRDLRVFRLLERHARKMRYLALTTASGPFPRHPLYLKDAARPVPVEPIWKNLLQRKP